MLRMRQTIASFFSRIFSSNTIEETSEWCFIPAGTVRIQGARGSYVSTNSFEPMAVDAFMIAKYPVTNAAFARFIGAAGYDNAAFWTDEGWDYRQRENWTQPKYWDDPNFNQANHPVVGITWYESLAYCHWLDSMPELRAEVPAELRINLPTESHWQRAAQGDDNRVYPWGYDFQPSFANTKESDLQQTTLVTQFPDAVSPFMVCDMAGNVLEWTSTDWATGTENIEDRDVNRILRGGSFSNSQGIAKVTARSYSNAYFRRNNFGFRICAVSRFSF